MQNHTKERYSEMKPTRAQKPRLRLQLLAFAAGDSATDIARHASISSTYCSTVLNSHAVPSHRVLRRLAARYGVEDPAALLDKINLEALYAYALR